MENILQEKAIEENNVSVFPVEDDDDDVDYESNRSFAGDLTVGVDADFDSTQESSDPGERTIYWESQEALLQEVIERYSMTGAKLRQEVSRVIEMARETNLCDCIKPKQGSYGCANCLRRRVVELLCLKGFNATLCMSKWKHTHKFPGGTHEYIELIATTQGRKKQVPLLIELEFRDEFQMAKGCDEYCKLINQLPETYIGAPEYLNAIVRVVCNAAKRSTKEKKIHMGPWRKRSFMQMKWSGRSFVEEHSSSSRMFPLLLSSKQVNNMHTSIRFCLDISSSSKAVEVS